MVRSTAKALKYLVGALLLIAAGSTLAMILRVPSHDRDWRPGHARLPNVTLAGDRVSIEGFRDFSYGPGGTPSETRYQEESYRLSEIESLWYGISHFGPFGLAHTFLSVGFADGRYLALSIEVYNPLLGLFGAYELIIVAGSERDVIGLRSHRRGERVYLYRIDVPKASIEPHEGYPGGARVLSYHHRQLRHGHMEVRGEALGFPAIHEPEAASTRLFG
jgi:hypothetical protein